MAPHQNGKHNDENEQVIMFVTSKRDIKTSKIMCIWLGKCNPFQILHIYNWLGLPQIEHSNCSLSFGVWLLLDNLFLHNFHIVSAHHNQYLVWCTRRNYSTASWHQHRGSPRKCFFTVYPSSSIPFYYTFKCSTVIAFQQCFIGTYPDNVKMYKKQGCLPRTIRAVIIFWIVVWSKVLMGKRGNPTIGTKPYNFDSCWLECKRH